MAEPFLTEIRLMSFNFAPKGWAQCNGQLLPINQNMAMFSLLGTTFGGDGRVNFALPDLRGRTPIHVGNNHTLGERGGEQAHTLSVSELPTHSHLVNARSAANSGQVTNVAQNNYLARGVVGVAGGGAAPLNMYGPPGNFTALQSGSLTNTGGSQAHLNMQPFLTLNFCIALQGIFPSAT
jgi:microcystin-dependent protein